MERSVVRVKALPPVEKSREFESLVFYAAIEKKNQLLIDGTKLGKVSAKIWFITSGDEDAENLLRRFQKSGGIDALTRSKLIKEPPLNLSACCAIHEQIAPRTFIFLEPAVR